MQKRIFSLLLVFSMFFLFLTSCAFSLSKKEESVAVDISMAKSPMLTPLSNQEILLSGSKPMDSITIDTITDESKKIVAFLPITTNETVNAAFKQWYEEKIAAYSPSAPEQSLRLDFSVSPYQNNVYSFFLTSTIFDGSQRKETFSAKTYDMTSGESLQLSHFFKPDSHYLTILSTQSKEALLAYQATHGTVDTEAELVSYTAPVAQNFEKFRMDAGGVSLAFPVTFSGGKTEIVVSIPYTTLVDCLKKESLPPATEPVTEEKPPVAIPKPVDGDKVVAFTFDDGPSRTTTPKILDKLEEKGGKGTFFVVGNRVKADDEILQRMAEMGCEVGNHSFDHANLKTSSQDERLSQINRTKKLIEENTKSSNTLLRPPYGSLSPDQAKNLGMSIILWSVDPEDWKYRDAQTVANNILKNVTNGSIILLHDIYETSYEGFCIAIDTLAQQGYRFVTISELCAIQQDTPTGQFYFSQTNIR